jgi:hypothetical protein
MGTAPEKPGERHLYRVGVPADGAWPAPAHCLTCPGQPPDASDAATDEPVCPPFSPLFKGKKEKKNIGQHSKQNHTNI